MLNADIASQTQLSRDHLFEKSSGYTIFWVGKPVGERHIGSVGFAIKICMTKCVQCSSNISDHIMKLRIPLMHDRFATILLVYVLIL